MSSVVDVLQKWLEAGRLQFALFVHARAFRHRRGSGFVHGTADHNVPSTSSCIFARALGRGGMRSRRWRRISWSEAGCRSARAGERAHPVLRTDVMERRVKAAVWRAGAPRRRCIEHQKLEALGPPDTRGIAHDFNNRSRR